MLKDFLMEGAPLEVPSGRNIIPNIKERLEKARKDKKLIIYLCDSHLEKDPEFKIWPPHAVKNTSGAQIVDELKPCQEEIVVEKTTYSGFYRTQLNSILKGLKVNRLILTGVLTNICVLYTAADAVMRGYKVAVPRDCVASVSEEDHKFALRQLENVLQTEII